MASLHAVATSQHHPHLGTGDVFAFGVAQGHTPAMLRKAFPTARLFGFDSFQGLPSEDDVDSRLPAWSEGSFGPKLTPVELEVSAGGRPKTVITAGFFDRTLTSGLATKLKVQRAVYIDVDCDLHSSTSSALEWMLTNRLLRVGTLIGFDDFWTIPCSRFGVSNGRLIVHPLDVGEGKAFREMTTKFGLRFRCLAGPCMPPPTTSTCHVHNNWAPIFLLQASGVPASEASTGFLFGGSGSEAADSKERSRRALANWMHSSRVCGSVWAK